MTERKHEKSPVVKITTKFGPVLMRVHDDDYIFMDANSHGVELDAPLIVNGVELKVSASVYKWTDGTWHLGTEFDDYGKPNVVGRWLALHASRVDTWKSDDASRSARNKLMDEFETQAQAFAILHQETLAVAARRRVSNNILDIDEEIEKQVKLVDELAATRRELINREEDLA